jgi:hypothetical protein
LLEFCGREDRSISHVATLPGPYDSEGTPREST